MTDPLVKAIILEKIPNARFLEDNPSYLSQNLPQVEATAPSLEVLVAKYKNMAIPSPPTIDKIDTTPEDNTVMATYYIGTKKHTAIVDKTRRVLKGTTG